MQRSWFKKIRKSEGFTQALLAIELDVSESMICAIERGKRNPSFELAKLMAIALNFEKYVLDWTRFFDEKDKSDFISGEEKRKIFEQLLDEIWQAKRLKRDVLPELYRISGEIDMAIQFDVLLEDQIERLNRECILEGIQEIKYSVR